MDLDCGCHVTTILDSLPTLEKKLATIRKCSAEDISNLVKNVIPQDRLPLQYLAGLSTGDRTVCYHTTMICWTVTGSMMVPREMQLQAVLSDYQKKDCLIAAGTGSGKTLPIALCILLNNPAANLITITISPLKCL